MVGSSFRTEVEVIGPSVDDQAVSRFLGFFRNFLKTEEEKKLHGPLEKNNKNYGKKIKFEPPPPGGDC